jgi:hypothetical protein
VGYSKLNIQDVEGAGPGGAFHFVRRELGVLAFGVNWIEIPPGSEGRETRPQDCCREPPRHAAASQCHRLARPSGQTGYCIEATRGVTRSR